MDDTRFVRIHDLLRKKDPLRDVLADLARHVVALDAVYRRGFVGILLFDLFVVAFDQAQDLFVGRVGFPHELTGITVGDILSRHFESFQIHDLVFHDILDLFHAERALSLRRDRFHVFADLFDLRLRKSLSRIHFIVGFRYRRNDLIAIEHRFGTASFNDFHSRNSPSDNE